MNRRKFVATVPVLAAGLTGVSPLLAGPLANSAAQEAALSDFHTFFAAHQSALSTEKAAVISQLSTPVSSPEFVDGKLTFKVKSGDTATLFRRNGELKIIFS